MFSSSKMGAQGEVKKIMIISVVSERSFVFWPSHNMLIIRDHDSERKVELGYSTSRILEILIERADSIVNRDDIFAFAWPDRIVGQNSLNQAISTIRELLSDEERKSIIQTIPRRGYQFNSECLASPDDFALSGEPTQVSPGLNTQPSFIVAFILWLEQNLIRFCYHAFH
jgi:cholera toxin transcriptional activator